MTPPHSRAPVVLSVPCSAVTGQPLSGPARPSWARAGRCPAPLTSRVPSAVWLYEVDLGGCSSLAAGMSAENAHFARWFFVIIT